MEKPFKMKGQPFKRNFGIGVNDQQSPLTHKTGSPHCHPSTNPDGSPSDETKDEMKKIFKKKKKKSNE